MLEHLSDWFTYKDKYVLEADVLPKNRETEEYREDGRDLSG